MDRHLRLRRPELRRARGDGGLAIVEMAIVAPLLAVLMAGMMEFGLAWRDDLTITNGTRAAARVVSNLGDNRLADYEALLTLEAGIGSLRDATVTGVLVYDAVAADGEPPSGCFDGGGDPQSVSGSCNAYTEAELSALAQSQFSGTTSCGAGALDAAWCPIDREVRQSAGPDYVGVWIRVERDWFTGMFPGSGITLTDHTVMRIEPGIPGSP